MAYSSLWSDGRADDHKAQQQQLSPLLFVPTVVWTQLSSGPGSTIHKYQVAAFSSISVVVYKVQALHFLTQPPQDSSLLWPRPCRSNTAIVDLYPPPTTLFPRPAEVTKESPWLLSVCSSCSFLLHCYDTCSTDLNCKSPIWTWGGALRINVTALAMSSAFKHFILSYTAAAFSGSLLWCRKANSVSTIPGDIHVALMWVFASRSSCRIPSVKAVTAYLVAQ